MLAWCALLAVLPAESRPVKLLIATSVLGREAESDLDAAEAMRREVEDALRYLLTVEVIGREGSEQLLAQAASHCGKDAACRSARFAEGGVDLLLTAVWNRSLALCSAELLEVASGRSLGSAAEALKSSETRGPTLNAMIDHILVGAGFQSGGALRIHARPEDAEIALDPPAERRLPDGQLLLAAGTHQLRADRDGYLPYDRTLEVLPKRDLDVDLSLEPRSVLSSPWLWGTVGAAAVAAVIVVVAVVAKSDTYYFCHAPAGAPCP
ncbi:MAG: hypothetical protein U1E65_21705 [Myxococcota bacterium]